MSLLKAAPKWESYCKNGLASITTHTVLEEGENMFKIFFNFFFLPIYAEGFPETLAALEVRRTTLFDQSG